MASAISKVKQKLKQVKFRHLKSYLKENLKADPRNCTHNVVTKASSGVVSVCDYEGSDTYGKVCDMNFNMNRALECGLFCPKKDKEQLKSEFYSFVDQSSVGELAREFPDITALMWVLDTLGADDTDTELKEHYEKIESLTSQNHSLSQALEDLNLMVTLQTTEIKKLELDKKELQEVFCELKEELEEVSTELRHLTKENEQLSNDKLHLYTLLESEKEEKTQLSKRLNSSFWSKIIGWFK